MAQIRSPDASAIYVLGGYLDVLSLPGSDEHEGAPGDCKLSLLLVLMTHDLTAIKQQNTSNMNCIELQ